LEVYEARLCSPKRDALNQRKKFEHLGVIMDRTHHKGLKYGPDFDNLSDLPQVEDGQDVAVDTIHAHYDHDPFEFDGTWGPDSRLCLQADAPRPCAILAATLPIEEFTREGYSPASFPWRGEVYDRVLMGMTCPSSR
jgi:hypothetical protein